MLTEGAVKERLSQPKNIKAIFYPVLFVDGEIKSFNDNFFYKKWLNIEIKNNLINFILPIEDLDDISEIVKMKNKIEELNIDTLVNKYNVISYVFALMSYQEIELNVHLKTNFNNNKLSKLSLFFKKKIIEISYVKKTHHIGSCLSCIDILVALFFGVMKFSKNFLLRVHQEPHYQRKQIKDSRHMLSREYLLS